MQNATSLVATDKAGWLDRIAELEAELAKAQVVIRALREQIEALQRAGKRQAVLFARREVVEKTKKPGRKRGQGKILADIS